MSMIPHWPRRRGGASSQTLVMIALAATVLALTFLLGTLFGDSVGGGSGETKQEGRPTAVNRDQDLPNSAQPGRPPVNPEPSDAPQIAKPGSPPVQLEPATVDLGVLRPHTKVEATSYIVNTGSEPLTIQASRPSCSCTAIDMSGTVIQPGDRVPLVATFDSQSSLGTKSSAVRLSFEGYAEVVQVRITAEVSLPVRALPSTINALQASSGRFVVESEDGRPFNVLAVDDGPPPFVGFDPMVDEPRNSYTLSWDVTGFDARTCADADGNRMRPWVLIETDHPECRLIDLSLRHNCTRIEGLSPGQPFTLNRRGMLGTIPAESPTEFTHDVRWTQNAPRNDRIVTARSLSPQFAAELVSYEREDMSGHCLLRVTPAPGVRGLVYGDLELMSSSGRTQVFTVMALVE